MLYFLRIAERVQWWTGKPKKALIGVANNIGHVEHQHGARQTQGAAQKATKSATLTRPAQSTSAR